MRQRMDRWAAARRDATVDVLHGRAVTDPYRWLEDADSDETRRWERTQDRLYLAERARWARRAEFRRALVELADVQRISPPVVRGDRCFFTRRGPGADHAVLVVRDSTGDRGLVDPILLDPSGGCSLEAWSPSPDGESLAYQVSSAGTESATLWVLDVSTGKPVDGPIDRVRRTSIAWLPDGRSFYYVRRQSLTSHYHRRVRLHEVGADPDGDVCVFGDGRPGTRYYAVATSSCGRWLTVRATEGASAGGDLWFADLTEAPPRQPRLRPVHENVDARTVATFLPDRVVLRTDLGAPTGRVVTAPLDDPTPPRWTTLIGARENAVLDDFVAFSGAGVGLATWLVDGAHHVTVHDLATGVRTGTVSLPGTGRVSRIEVAQPGTATGYFEYTDFTTPPTVLRFDAEHGSVGAWPAPAATGRPGAAARPGGAARPGATARPGGAAVTATVEVESTGGARVPVFVVSPTGRPDQPRPTMLCGYGGFGVPMTPAFSSQALTWVQAGGVYVVAGVRGGGERGREWHLDAVGERRQNAFDDFDAVARYLVAAGWTDATRLGIHGSSNGGLLMCVALTQHPERYRAVAALAPLTDMVRYEGFGMGPSWRGEYGSAAEPEGLATLLSYSPYHHTRPGTTYPAVLLAAFDGDSRVDPMHARKMCAALQHASSGERPVVYRLERGVGHGVRPLSSMIDLLADVNAFLAAELGLDGGEVRLDGGGE